jgi:hypothetical protein
MDIPTLHAPRPITTIIEQGEADFASDIKPNLSDLEIDEYVTHFYERRVDLITFEPNIFTLEPHELNELLNWIKSYNDTEKTEQPFSPYHLYRKVIDANLSVPEQLICFEHIYLVIKSHENKDDDEVNIFGDESALDDTYDD